MLTPYKKKLQNSNKIYLQIKVKPGANKTEPKSIMENNTIKLNIAAIPEKGKANQELIKFLAKEFNTSKENIKIISGAGDKTKLIKITNPT